MSENTAIQWCHHTFNPWRGCTRVSEGCRHCYAETLSKRNPKVLGVWGNDGTRVVASEAYWREPLKWNRAALAAGERRRVFCASLADVFEDRPDLVGPRERLFVLIDETPQLDWLLLTKRPENIAALLPKYWGDKPWPNVWLGTTTENQAAADERIPRLLQTPAAVHFISAEPLLEEIDVRRYLAGNDAEREQGSTGKVVIRHRAGISWLIVGGESGSYARPFDLAWARSLKDQVACSMGAARLFVKQFGACIAWPPAKGIRRGLINVTLFRRGENTKTATPYGYQLCDRKGGDPLEWPSDLCVREFPTVRA